MPVVNLFQTVYVQNFIPSHSCWHSRAWQKGGHGVSHLMKNKGKQLQHNTETDLQAELSSGKIIPLTTMCEYLLLSTKRSFGSKWLSWPVPMRVLLTPLPTHNLCRFEPHKQQHYQQQGSQGLHTGQRLSSNLSAVSLATAHLPRESGVR